jgi:hypothetical protein
MRERSFFCTLQFISLGSFHPSEKASEKKRIFSVEFSIVRAGTEWCTQRGTTTAC